MKKRTTRKEEQEEAHAKEKERQEVLNWSWGIGFCKEIKYSCEQKERREKTEEESEVREDDIEGNKWK